MAPSLAPPPVGRTIYIVPAGHRQARAGNAPTILAGGARPKPANSDVYFRAVPSVRAGRVVAPPPQQRSLYAIPKTVVSGGGGSISVLKRPPTVSVPTRPHHPPPQAAAPPKKRRLEEFKPSPQQLCQPYPNNPYEQPSEEQLVDIAEVYHLLGEHFGSDADGLNFDMMAQPRKRERLTNLTKEEKLHRRKLKNRVAAQTARDRKKERSIRLEKAVRALLQETSRLRAQNASMLRELNQLKQSENAGYSVASNQVPPQPMYSQQQQQRLSHTSMEEKLPEVMISTEAQQQQPKSEERVQDTFGSAEELGIQYEPDRARRRCLPAFASQPAEQIEQKPLHGLFVDHHPHAYEHCAAQEVSQQQQDDDCELEAIFDDLFGTNQDPKAIDLFCNQVIEDELAATATETAAYSSPSPQTTADGAAEMVSPEQMSAAWSSPASYTACASSCSPHSSLESHSQLVEETEALDWHSSPDFDGFKHGLVDGCEDAMFSAASPLGHYTSPQGSVGSEVLLQEEHGEMFDQCYDPNEMISWGSPSSTINCLFEEELSSNEYSYHSEADDSDRGDDSTQLSSQNSIFVHPLVEFNEFAIL